MGGLRQLYKRLYDAVGNIPRYGDAADCRIAVFDMSTPAEVIPGYVALKVGHMVHLNGKPEDADVG